jgi:hypothetical protein
MMAGRLTQVLSFSKVGAQASDRYERDAAPRDAHSEKVKVTEVGEDPSHKVAIYSKR